MHLPDKLIHCEGKAFAAALDEATVADIEDALRNPNMPSYRRRMLEEALECKHVEVAEALCISVALSSLFEP